VAFFAYDYLATLFRTPDREGKTLLRARVEMENLCSAWFSVSSKVLGFLLKICFFYSGQILEMYVVLLYFPFKNTVISHA